MTMSDSDQPLSDLPGAAAPAEPTADAAAKPRRKRVAKAVEAVEAVEAVQAVEAVEAVQAAAADMPAPAAVAAVAEDTGPEAAAKPKRARRKPADVAAAAADSAPAPTDAAPAPVAAPEAPAPAALANAEVTSADTTGIATSTGDASADADADADTDADGPRKRNRNRRRGRRGGAERGPRDDAAPGDVAQVLTVSADAADDDADDADDDSPGAAPAEQPPALPKDVGETFAAVLSGDYDALPIELPAADAERRVLAAEPDAPKLHKVLAQAGIGSRRDMEALIAEGQVMVNGQVAHTGQRISFGDRISVAGRLIKVRIAPPPPRIIAYHKPVGEVVTHDDPQHRPTVFRRLPRLPHGKWQSVGRLDINTEGLLLFTNSGELANQLMHPRFGVEREYAVRVLGTLTAEAKARLIDGVDIDGQRASFKSIEDGGGEGVNHWYRVVITEGRNREVRKLFDKVGLGVSRLIRIRYGCVVLPRGLKRGVFVDLNEADVREVRRLAGNAREQQAEVRAPKPARQDGPRDGSREGPRDGPRDGPGQQTLVQHLVMLQ